MLNRMLILVDGHAHW